MVLAVVVTIIDRIAKFLLLIVILIFMIIDILLFFLAIGAVGRTIMIPGRTTTTRRIGGQIQSIGGGGCRGSTGPKRSFGRSSVMLLYRRVILRV